jgi:hypothetical protein
MEIAMGTRFVKDGPSGAEQQRSSVPPDTHKPRAFLPEAFLFFSQFFIPAVKALLLCALRPGWGVPPPGRSPLPAGLPGFL